jgi:insertion element IS1 protein InsB
VPKRGLWPLFVSAYLTYKGLSPEIKEHILDMALNGSGIRDTARVLKVSPTTVINELKKN